MAQSRDLADAGFDNVLFKGCPVVSDDKQTAGYVDALNTKYLDVLTHSRRNFTTPEWKSPIQQPDTATANIRWAGNLICKNRKAHARATGITDLAQQSVDTLSGGQRQRAWIAMVLAQETAIMLLDEPTTWLDISHQIDLLELLSELNREKGYTLAAVLHDLNQACRYATHLIALRDGKIIAEGAPKEIVTAELIERIYGLRCTIIDDPVAHTPLVVPLGRR